MTDHSADETTILPGKPPKYDNKGNLVPGTGTDPETIIRTWLQKNTDLLKKLGDERESLGRSKDEAEAELERLEKQLITRVENLPRKDK